MSESKSGVQSQWDERYTRPDFAYGEQPNDFLKSVENRFTAGSRILSVAEGEGRNAVFLATRGHSVTAVDISPVGLTKAKALAAKNSVSITTVVADLANFSIEEAKWDGIVSIWCHTPADIRQRLHKLVVAGLKPGGFFCLEAYTPKQLEYKTGGPKDSSLMMTLESLRKELPDLEFLVAQEIIREIHEGPFHNGTSAVVQVLARKL